MFKKITDLSEDLHLQYENLLNDFQYYAALPPTINNLKKEFAAQYRWMKFMNRHFPFERNCTEKDLYRLQIINTYLQRLEDSTEYISDSKYIEEFQKLFDILYEAKNYGRHIKF